MNATRILGRFPLGIRGRLTLWFVLGAVGAVVVGGIVVYVTGMASIKGTLGQTYCQIASRIVGQTEDQFRREADFVQNIATDVLTTEVLLEWNDLYRNRPNTWVDARLHRQASEWQAAANERRRLDMLHPQLSHRMAVLVGLKEKVVKRFAIYDRLGVVAAASSPPTMRVSRGESWFSAVTGVNVHFTYLDFDKSKQILRIIIPVWGGVEIVGFVVAEYDSSLLVGPVDDVRFGDSGEAMLVDYAGVPLRGAPRNFLVQTLSRKPPEVLVSIASSESSSPYWVSLPPGLEWPLWERLACVAPVTLLNTHRRGFKLPPWSVVVTQSPKESYMALEHSLRSFAIAGLVGILVVGIGGAFLAWHISQPLKELQSSVRRFARGDRDTLMEVASTDEIGELANEFNRMAQRVTESENELQAFAKAVEGATDAIVLTDPKGAIYYANPAFETTTGYAFDEVKGKTPSFLRDPEAAPETYSEMWQATIEGQPWRGELWNRRKNDEVYLVDLSISPILDEHHNVVSLLGIHRDITLAHAYQEKLEKEVEARTREIAETQSLAITGRMASMIAHDLRNSLSTIKMNLQILLKRHQEENDVENEHCRMGLDQVRYMEEILRDMLSYARPEKLRADWCDLAQIFDESLIGFLPIMDERKIRVVCENTKALPKVYCDRVKVVEILKNLIDNAVQAMPNGGQLNLVSRLLLNSPEPVVQIEVWDSGEGIPDDVRPNVFEPFFTTRAKGTGLGLAIVKRIVEQHGCEIEIDAGQGGGTRVLFTLPTVPNRKLS